MNTLAVVLEKPEHLVLSRLELTGPTADDVVVDIDFSGISTGTEKLLWSGRMPSFPGMGYPLVPGYESVGRVVEAGPNSGRAAGDAVFVPGSNCFGEVRGLFGGAAAAPGGARCTGPAHRPSWPSTACCWRWRPRPITPPAAAGMQQPDLIVGHGVLGRMIARLAVLAGAAPVVWETNAGRREGAQGYEVMDPATDTRRDYKSICDVSGDASHAGHPDQPPGPRGRGRAGRLLRQAAVIRVPAGLHARGPHPRCPMAAHRPGGRCGTGTNPGALSLDGLITHRADASDADAAYRTAFGDPACLKMILDWRTCQ
jgi:3-hydroxyethyl bacteriochlorophyllide a dehydrogenase